ncbi:hypothetical protein GCM10023259_099280 [Thermocatellispora tengchongensis]
MLVFGCPEQGCDRREPGVRESGSWENQSYPGCRDRTCGVATATAPPPVAEHRPSLPALLAPRPGRDATGHVHAVIRL